jgi:2-oxoglutarate dehydrogenase E2 component (dihydrolipoamide succinyltransferase)
VAEILVPEGETVDVGTKLAVITDRAPSGDGTAPAVRATSGAIPAPSEPAAASGPAALFEPQATAPPPPEPEPARAAERAPEPEPARAVERAPEPEPEPEPAMARRAAGTHPADERPPGRPSDGGKVLSPVVRRLISEHGLDPDQIQGTGAGGRITRSDVLALIDQRSAGNGGRAPTRTAKPASGARGPAAPPATTPTPTARATADVSTPAAGERDEVVPFTNIRRRTAEHMVRSKATSAHTVVAMEVDYEGVERVRRPERERFKEEEGFGLTYLPFLARAVIDAIEDWPHINSSVGDDELIVHHYVNLGIAVDLNFEGLLVPVIHDADTKRLRAIAREISTLASRARSKRLTMDDISGGTFTITNAGPFGTLFTVPIINQPQVAILATDGVRKRPVVVELPDGTDGITVHPVGNLVLAFDHRAFDGAYASAFMAEVKEIVETRDWSAEL